MKILSSKLKPGFAPIMVIGLILIIGVIFGVAFGPDLGGKMLGQLANRQEEQQSHAQVGYTTPSYPTNDPDGDGFNTDLENKIGTSPTYACLTTNPGGPPSSTWPLDLKTGSTSYNKINVEDLASFTAPVRRMGTKTGDANFNKRWDLDANGKIDVVDLAKLSAGPTAYPPMLGGARALNGPPCPSPTYATPYSTPYTTPNSSEPATIRIVVTDQFGQRVSNANVVMQVGDVTPPRYCTYEGKNGSFTAAPYGNGEYRFPSNTGGTGEVWFCNNVGGQPNVRITEEQIIQAFTINIATAGYQTIQTHPPYAPSSGVITTYQFVLSPTYTYPYPYPFPYSYPTPPSP